MFAVNLLNAGPVTEKVEHCQILIGIPVRLTREHLRDKDGSVLPTTLPFTATSFPA